MKKLLMFAALTALLASCSNEEGTNSQIKSNELGVAVNVAGSITSRAATGMIGTAFKENAGIGILANGAGITPTTAQALYEFDGTLWKNNIIPSRIKLINSSPVNVYGWFPGDAVLTPDGTDVAKSKVAVQLGVGAKLDGSDVVDYMYSTGKDGSGAYYNPVVVTSDIDKNRADLFFHHALSKVSLVINKAVSYKYPGVLSKVEFSSATDLFKSGTGTMEVGNGTLAGLATLGKSFILDGTPVNINEFAEPTAATTPTTTALFAPLGTVAGVIAKITIDGKTLSVTLPTTNVSKWDAGKNYIYTITVKEDFLNVNSVTVVDWEAVDGGNSVVSYTE